MSDIEKFVDWYHRKYRINYSYNWFKTIKKDHEVLLNLIEQHQCRTVLEIGTWLGDTALLMYLYPLVQRVKCIDICKEMNIEFKHPAHELMPKEEYGKMFKNTFIQLQFADTLKYPRGCEQHDLVFIDGNHNYQHVKNDTELAISMHPKVICWHDYGGGNDDVVKFINELIVNKSQLMAFEGSLCVAAEPKNIII